MSNFLGKDLLYRLDLRIIDLAYHVSEYPFPGRLLPPLPPGLRNIERVRAAHKQHISEVGESRSWWDSIQISGEAILLPDPPTGSADAGICKWLQDRTEHKNSCKWSDEMYQHAISAANCLQFCLQYLNNRSKSVNLSLDIIAICKGLCRCSDAARAIEERLNATQSSQVEISSLLNGASIVDRTQPPNRSFQIENSALLTLGPSLNHCASNLLLLMDYVVFSSVQMEAAHLEEVQGEILGSIMPSLEHTQIESMGIGCTKTSDEEDGKHTNFDKAISKHIREHLVPMSQSVQGWS